MADSAPLMALWKQRIGQADGVGYSMGTGKAHTYTYSMIIIHAMTVETQLSTFSFFRDKRHDRDRFYGVHTSTNCDGSDVSQVSNELYICVI